MRDNSCQQAPSRQDVVAVAAIGSAAITAALLFSSQRRGVPQLKAATCNLVSGTVPTKSNDADVQPSECQGDPA